MVEVTNSNNVLAGCFLEYPCFNKHSKFITINLSKHQVSDADPRIMQQINFVGIPNIDKCAAIFFFLKNLRKRFWNPKLMLIKWYDFK